jgi:hypothetical protein
MSGFIASNSNRFYCATEAQYGRAATISAANRFPAVKMQAHQAMLASRRRDKTGSRTFRGTSQYARRASAFDVRTYLTSWNASAQPSYGPLFQCALGGTPQISSNLTVAAVPTAGVLQTTVAHGLDVGSGVAYAGEIRFVTAVPDDATLKLNAPFSSVPYVNAALAPAINYGLATTLPSVTLFDYWDPAGAVSRIVTGGAVNAATVTVNGDFHEFHFSGPACDLIDSSNTHFGVSGLTGFPAEPQLGTFDYSIVPGHLGQVWLGSVATQFFTLTSAVIEIKNNIGLRNQEFGSVYPAGLVPGEREINVNFTLLAQDDSQTAALYSAAKLRTPIAAMLQLGQQQGQTLGVYLPNIVPEIPDYIDSEPRLQWHFSNCLAQGTSNDELYLAFA